MEIRIVSFGVVRSDENASKPTIYGTAIRYGAVSPTIGGKGGFHERVLRGAVDKSLRSASSGKKDIFSTVEHNTERPIGRTSIRSGPGSLTLTSDRDGVNYRCELNNTSYATDLFENVRSGVIRGFSWGMNVDHDEWDDDYDCDGDPDCDSERCASCGSPHVLRSIDDLDLIECSPCLMPAYGDATPAFAASRAACFVGEIPAEIRSRFPRLVLPTFTDVFDSYYRAQAEKWAKVIEEDEAKERHDRAVRLRQLYL